jgi:hypothetical protein
MEEQGVRRSEQVVFLVVDDYVIRYKKLQEAWSTVTLCVCMCV